MASATRSSGIMMAAARLLLLLAFAPTTTDASFLAPLAPRGASSRHLVLQPAALAQQRTARHAIIAASAEEPAAEGEAEAEWDEAAAAESEGEGEPAPPAAEVAEEEEEDDDLLSSPAFLKQKLKVLEKEMASVQEQGEGLDVQIEEANTEWQQKRERLQTDFANFKARHYNQTLDAQADSKAELVKELLPVLDNFDRARASIKLEGEEQEATDARYQEMYEALMITLEELGVEKIPTVGEEFDYNLHMAIQQAPSDEYAEGIVSSEMQPGYTLRGRLVRVAYVMVSSG